MYRYFRTRHVQDKRSFVKVWSPYYSIKKESTRNLLIDFELIGGEIQPEKQVDSGNVKGRIDLFERLGNEVRIVDFKTGLIFNYKGRSIKEVKKQYIEQLTLYGAALASQENVPPENITVALKGLTRGEYFTKRLSQDDCNNVSERLTYAIESTEESIIGNNLDDLASPDVDTCKYCEFIHKCRSVQQSVASNPIEWKNYVVLKSIDAEFNYEDLEITVLVNGYQISISNIPFESFSALKSDLDQGKTILLSGLYSGELPQIRRWTQYADYFAI